jgi:hypothetical protein
MFRLFILLNAASAFAAYQKFFFSAYGTCPGLAWPCVQNSVLVACAYDSLRISTTVAEVLHRPHVVSLALNAWVLMVNPLLHNSAAPLENPPGAVLKRPRALLPGLLSSLGSSSTKSREDRSDVL